MANLPGFGRSWPRLSSLPRPGSASRSEVRASTALTELEAFSSAPTATGILRTSPPPPPPSSPKYSGKAACPPTESVSGKAQQKQHQQLQSEDINMEGENVGAVMHIAQSSDALQIQKKKQSKESEEKEEKWSWNLYSSWAPFINTNFQSVNNSLMYSSSLTHRDPGLHLAFSKSTNHGDPLDHDSTH